jgi:alkylation response protein AidB-like acyl-CoA dehydrogenase
MAEPEAVTVSLDQFRQQASTWLAHHGQPIDDATDRDEGTSTLGVAVFHSLDFDAELAVIRDAQQWCQRKAQAGYHAITEPTEFGGLGLSKEHAQAFGALERTYRIPAGHELFSVTTDLIAPTIAVFGDDEQKQRYVARFLSATELCCQLFSEPGAGSDLAALGCRAVRDGDAWVVNGQKVWSSGAQFAEWGLLIARTDVNAPKHRGMTAFLVPLATPGVEVRPIRQMSGGTSFNEVFFDECRIGDHLRLGGEGDGWKVALTTLEFERDHSDPAGASGTNRPGGTWHHLLHTAEQLGVTGDALTRQALMDVYIHKKVEAWLNQRAADLRRGGTPGPEGSLGKLMWTEGMTKLSQVVAHLLGPRLCAQSGEPATFEWNEHVLGAPGYRIAGGSDEVQRNIIGERVLGLPPEPRVDKGIAWKDVPR